MAGEAEQGSVSCVLIGRCGCDQLVRYVSGWCEEVITEAGRKNIDVIDLKDRNFCEEKFMSKIKKFEPGLVFLNGHGEEYQALGYRGSPVLVMNKNDYLLKGKRVHIISCKTAMLLAHSARDKGCEGYIGYNGDFCVYPFDFDSLSLPDMFMEAVNAVSLSLMENDSVTGAYDKSQQVYERNIRICEELYSDKDLSDSQRDGILEVKSRLELNRERQIVVS